MIYIIGYILRLLSPTFG